MKKIGLVLEGGGMRGLFTAGVLDFFLDKNIEFTEIIGVSAGACNACSYLSKQKYRGRDVILDYINDRRYCSFYNLRKTGDLFEPKFTYYEIPNKLNIFDNETFKKSKAKFLVGVTNVKTGMPEYIHIKDAKKDIEAIRASASLPVFANIVKYKGKEYLDGGLSDAIPIKKIEKDGCEKNIVILTRSLEYQKRQSRAYLFMKKKYRNYPKIVELIKNRHLEYNASLEYLKELEKQGKALIIRPSSDLKIKRIEKNSIKLELAYNDGYAAAKNMYQKILDFLNDN